MLCFNHKRAMVTLFAIPRAIRSLKKTGTEFIQSGALILSQHACSRLIDRHNAAILVDKNNPFVEIIKDLLQFGQSNHKRLSFQRTHNLGNTDYLITKENSPQKCGLLLGVLAAELFCRQHVDYIVAFFLRCAVSLKNVVAVHIKGFFSLLQIGESFGIDRRGKGSNLLSSL